MKIKLNSDFILFLGVSLLMCSCEKPSPPKDYFPDWGEVSVLKNGVPEMFRITGNVFTLDGQRFCNVFLNTKLDFYMRKEVWMQFLNIRPMSIDDTVCIAFTNIFFPEPHPCVGTYFSSVFSGDVIGDSYNVIPDNKNYMVLTDWDPVELTISGEFQVSYYFSGQEHVHDWMPDTIRFTEGRFTTRLKDLTLDEK